MIVPSAAPSFPCAKFLCTVRIPRGFRARYSLCMAVSQLMEYFSRYRQHSPDANNPFSFAQSTEFFRPGQPRGITVLVGGQK